MGLAASQARFLGLTARKSNVEFQGQQINQARTALSNEVMGLYNKYNELDAPVPPSVNNYQKTTYKLDSTPEGYEVTNFTKILDGQYAGYYKVTLQCNEEVPKVYSQNYQEAAITAKKGEIKETNEQGNETSSYGYTYLNFQLGAQNYYYDVNDPKGSTVTKITGDYDKYQGLTNIMASQGLTDGTFYMYMKNGTAYYTSEADLEATSFTAFEDEQRYSGPYSFDYQGTQTKAKTIDAIGAIDEASSGRLSAVQIIECEEDPDLVNNTYSVTTSGSYDQLAYEDAMNQYNYEKAQYEKEVDDINRQIEKIQTEDKSLELKLGQLDTEQKAISTEMDSISEVIKNTIDSVFKTFNS